MAIVSEQPDMTKLSESDEAFLTRRQRLMRYWPFAGALAGLALLALSAWLWIVHPLLVNPFEIQRRLQAGMPGDGSVALMAAMLPVVIDLCLLLTLTVIAFTAVSLNNERRYFRMLRAAGYDL